MKPIIPIYTANFKDLRTRNIVTHDVWSKKNLFTYFNVF